MWEVCCHIKYMETICPTIQAANVEAIRDIGLFSLFAQSPYALSLSFLEDRSLIGNNDAEAKYNLNLDEEAVATFY